MRRRSRSACRASTATGQPRLQTSVCLPMSLAFTKAKAASKFAYEYHRNDESKEWCSRTMRGRMRRSEEGQATVEWTALVALAAIVLGGLGYAVVRVDAWRLGDGLVHSLLCAAAGGCAAGEDALTAAYGSST